MPYIVKSSLDISGKIVPWNEVESNKLIEEKEKFLKENKKENKKEDKTTQEVTQEATQEKEIEKEEIKTSKADKKKK